MQITNSYASPFIQPPRVDIARKTPDASAVSEASNHSPASESGDEFAAGSASDTAEPKFPYYDILGRPRDLEGRLVDEQGHLLQSEAVEKPPENSTDKFWEQKPERVQLFPTRLISKQRVLEHAKLMQDYNEFVETVLKYHMRTPSSLQQMMDDKVTSEMPKAVEWLDTTVSVYNVFKQRANSEQYRTDAAYKASVDNWLANSKSLVTNAYQAIAGQTDVKGSLLEWNADGTLNVPSFALALKGQTILTHTAAS
ncbi:hypothetical protein [Rhizobium oryzicola]|uniref:Uncharacterized protein n=1 Tax=Rhizobium oryzicola TaxID=1232668 RepID=A0ABT8SUU4_9HYPH|nr:hypothetical protein [Rhizobium oryzicola]MDO1582193.1 hypothetical protein [Rhizobium oryzicola]